jgi:CHAT domain-containing protein
MALAERDSGELEKSYAFAASAVAIAETLRGNVEAENLRISFLASMHDYYSAFVDISMRKGNTIEGWQIAERARARALLDSVSHGSRSDREEQLIRQLNSESLKLMRAPQDSEDRARRLADLNAELISVEDRARTADGRDAKFRGSSTIELSELQNQLSEDLAIVEYSLGEACGYAWVITRNSVDSFHLPARKEIEAAAQVLNLRLSDGRQAVGMGYRRAAGALSGALILPASFRPNVKRLIFIPDGSLQLTPFEALPIGSGVTLIDRYEVSEAPSAAVLIALAHRLKSRSSMVGRVALLGDPVFDAYDARLKTRSATDGQTRFARLPFSRREVMAIASLGSENITTLLDFDAMKEVLVSGRLKDYRIIHLSTHAFLDEADPNRAALVFSLVDRSGARKDGVLSANEASALDLSADLVVLSACGTAAGRQWQGEGMLSLTRAFLEAGASRGTRDEMAGG